MKHKYLSFKFSKTQLDKISDICVSVGQVFIASIVIEPLIKGGTNQLGFFGSLILSIIMWGCGVWVIRNNHL